MVSIRLDRLPFLVRAGEASDQRRAAGHPSRLAILPGSFDPVHEGHWGLAHAAERLLGHPVAFELSIINVDKAEQSVETIERRVAQFSGRADVWVTRAARFVDKAELFPGATFVIGIDTAARLIDPRYYDDDPIRMEHALLAIRAKRCRFMVGGRLTSHDKFATLEELPIPVSFCELFTGIPEQQFRYDTSSTALRKELKSHL